MAPTPPTLAAPTPAPSSPAPSSPAGSTALLVVVAAVIAFGVVLRLLGFFDLQLWLDEASWCKRLVDGHYGWIRPVGYMWITRQLVLLHDSEPMLRSLSYLAGLAQLPLLWLLLRRLVAVPAVAAAAVFVLAIHPIAVAMTKEFKPYATESCLHTALLLMTLLYVTTWKRGWLLGVLGLAVIGPLFAWTLIFAYPAVFAVIGLSALLARRKNDVVTIVAGTGATFAVLIAIFIGRVSKEKRDTDFWGEKYDVFYIGDGGLFERLGWLVRKTAAVATFPADLHWPWGQAGGPGEQVLAVVVASLVGVGVVALLVRKQWIPATLLIAPWLVTIVFNVLGQWPYGLFRTNVFLLFYTLALAAVGVDALLSPLSPKRPVVVTAVVVAVCALLFPHDLAAFGQKREGTLTAEASVRTALEFIQATEQHERAASPEAPPAKPLLVMDGHACGIANYYRDYNVDSRPRLHEFFKNDVETVCSHVQKGPWLKTLSKVKGRSFWLIAGKRGFADFTRAELAPHCTVLHDVLLPETTLVYRCQARLSATASSSPASSSPASSSPASSSPAPSSPSP